MYSVPLDHGIGGFEWPLVLGEEKCLVPLWCWMVATATATLGGSKFALVGLCVTKMPGETGWDPERLHLTARG